MGSGRRRSFLPALLLLLLLPLLPAAWGDCGPLPNISHAEPLEDTKHQESFTVGSKIRYRCLTGFVKRPLMSDTIQCLANSQWSNLPEFCDRSCPSPPRVHFAKVSQEHETQNFYPVAVTVKYVCRPGYEASTDQLPTSTCLEDLTWSEVPELCQRKSCGIPANPEHGEVVTNDHLLGARATVVCNRGYTLKGASPLISCTLRQGEVAWSQVPACQPISCPPPPTIPDGQHNGNGTEEFAYNSVVIYTCDPGLQLVGNETLLCTTENSIDGVWSSSPPECRVRATAATNQTEPLEERTANNLYWLVGVIFMCIAVIVGVIVVLLINRWKDNKKRSDNACLPEHEVNGRDLPMHLKIMDDGKQPVLWHSYFCHTTSCHVCPSCEEQLHAALAPRAVPGHRGCAACERWLRAQPGTPRTYCVPSIEETHSPAEPSSPAKAADAGEAVSDTEQLADRESGHHICPICEDWLRAHDDQHGTHHVAPTREQQDQGPGGPVCPPCADQLHLSHVHSDTSRCPVCPLAVEGTLAHLVTQNTPGCHVCPVCMVPTHAHLCQPWHPTDKC
ncbi:uncharacterized protein [Patagioenas fasciata]|uniref:uncharacterized protein isoform X1 n=1 Tax=Patagioenas fasciata TaxID=372321 RepID=UPI0032E88C0B